MVFVNNRIKSAGLLTIIAMITGILSVTPSIDAVTYLTDAAQQTNQVIVAAMFQFTMALAYIGFAICLYPSLKVFDESLAIGFVSFRLIAATLVIFGTIILLSILILSQHYTPNDLENMVHFQTLGDVLKITRDTINHVFMILTWSIGNFLFYWLIIKSGVLPKWLAVWGLVGALFALIASLLVLFQVLDVISTEYILLNVPAALSELVLGIYLITKGFTKINNQ